MKLTIQTLKQIIREELEETAMGAQVTEGKKKSPSESDVKKAEKDLKKSAREKGFKEGSERWNKYVYGGKRKMGWKPKRELKESKPDENIIPEANVLHDDEGGAAQARLAKITVNAEALKKTIQKDQQLEDWIQAKLIRASDYLETVKNHFESERIKKLSDGQAWEDILKQ